MTQKQQPNVLFVIAGHPIVETPTIDNLASLGVRYANAYSECPIYMPKLPTPPQINADTAVGSP